MSLDQDPSYVFRDHTVLGVPSSGAHPPEKREIRKLLSGWWQALIALEAGQGGLDLPNLLIRYTVTGGSANAITAEPNLPVPTGPGVALNSIIITQPNTGPVTINGKPLRDNLGSEIAPGGLAPGAWLFLDAGDSFVLLQGPKGWSPVFATVIDSTTSPSRRVRQLTDWTGGQGAKPGGIGFYEGASGLVENIGDATDLRGPMGPSGEGGGDMTRAVYDPHDRAADVFDSANQVYDNAASGLGAPNVQGAIDELAARPVGHWVNVTEFGAVADGNGTGGGTNNTGAIQAAVDALWTAGGGVLAFGPGIYRVNGEITARANVMLDLHPEAVIDFTNRTGGGACIRASGSVGPEIALSAVATRGDTTIQTISAHGLALNDWVFLKSQRACSNQVDAGEFWLGETTAGTTPPFFAEPIQVAEVLSATSFRIAKPLIFPDYRHNASMETDAHARPAATVQKINFLPGVRIRGGKIIGGGTHIVRTNWCIEPVVDQVRFDLRKVLGSAVYIQNSLSAKVKAWTRHDADLDTSVVHHSYNSYMDVGAWLSEWDVVDLNGSQGIDVTYSGGGHPSILPTIRGMSIDNDYDGLNFHGCSYGGSIENYKVIRARRTGMRIRAPFVSIINPHIIGPNGGSMGGITFSCGGRNGQVSGGIIDGYMQGIRSELTGVSQTAPARRNLFIGNGLQILRADLGIYIQQAGSNPATAEDCGVTISSMRFDDCASHAIRTDQYVNGLVCDNLDIGHLQNSNAIGISLGNNCVKATLHDIRGRDIGEGRLLYQTGNLGDTTTFPPSAYRSILLNARNVRVFGSGLTGNANSTGAVLDTFNSSITLAPNDIGRVLYCTSSSAQTVTLPAQAVANIPIGESIDIVQWGTGQLTLAAGAGASVLSRNGMRAAGQYARITAYKRATNEWLLSGDTMVN